MILIHAAQVLIWLRWRASRWCDACLNFVFFTFFSWPAPFEPGGHPGEPWPEAAYWSLSWDHSSWESDQTATEILIAFKAGVGVDIFFSWFFHLFLQIVNYKSNTSPYPPSPCNRGAFNWTHLLRVILSSWLPLHSHASTKNGFLNICYFWYPIFMIFLYFFGNKIGRSFHAASRYLLLLLYLPLFKKAMNLKKRKKKKGRGSCVSRSRRFRF